MGDLKDYDRKYAVDLVNVLYLHIINDNEPVIQTIESRL